MMHTPQYALPSLGRAMIFIDGENLVARFQAMIDEGWGEYVDNVRFKKDTYVWSPTAVYLHMNVALRATYYTYVQGSSESIYDVEDQIKSLTFQNYNRPGLNFGHLPNRITPCVFSKPKGRKAKGVDIQLTVDILTHAYQNNLDAVFLMSGDGDYVPVLEEVRRLGKQIYLAAFSSGLSPKLRLMADYFICLDGFFFKSASGGNVPQGIVRPDVWDKQN